MFKFSLFNVVYLMAERMGFEPMKGLLLYTLSKRAPSTARPSLQFIKLAYGQLLIDQLNF